MGSLPTAVEKLERARAKLVEGGKAVPPELDHLLEALSGLVEAERELGQAAAAPPEGGWKACKRPTEEQPGSVHLFKGLYLFVTAAGLGTGSVGYSVLTSGLRESIVHMLEPFAVLGPDDGSGQRYMGYPTEQAVEAMIKEQKLGSMQILQMLATSCWLGNVADEDRMLWRAAALAGMAAQALCPQAVLAQHRGMCARLQAQHWVPLFPSEAAAAAEAAGAPGASGTALPAEGESEVARELRQDLRRYCGPSASLAALYEASQQLQLDAGFRMPSPQPHHLRLLLCSGQAVMDRCADGAATARHVCSIVRACELAMKAAAGQGDVPGTQAVLGPLEETLARCEEQKCYFVAAYAAMVLADCCANVGEIMKSYGAQLRRRGRPAGSAAEGAALLARAREVAGRVPGYGPRAKAWLPAGLQGVYARWVVQAATVERAAARGGTAEQDFEPGTAESMGTASFPVCAHCGKSSVHVRKCAQCKAVAYCSKECQKADWKSHKKQCAQLAAQHG